VNTRERKEERRMKQGKERGQKGKNKQRNEAQYTVTKGRGS
jgi:hypothetical protein